MESDYAVDGSATSGRPEQVDHRYDFNQFIDSQKTNLIGRTELPSPRRQSKLTIDPFVQLLLRHLIVENIYAKPKRVVNIIHTRGD